MSSFTQASEDFVLWFKSLPGANFSDAIKIVDLRDRNAGRGIVAVRDIDPETTLFTIPRQGILSVETSDLACKIPDVFGPDAQEDDDDSGAGSKLDPWTSLILVMIYEYLLGADSRWKPYFDVLPTTFDTPMFWSESELEHLQASHMRSKVGKEQAEENFQSRLLPVIRKHAELFRSSQSHSDEALIQLAHRMGSTIMAYAFDLENDEEQEDSGESEEWVEEQESRSIMGMVPMADILNADAEFNAHINHGEDSLTATALRPIKAGEEMLNYYGPHPNSELLRRYGYVTTKHLRYDVVEIPWTVVEEVMTTHFGISSELLEKIRNGADEEELEDTFVLERETSEPNPDGTFASFAIFEGMPEDLQQQLKEVLKAVKKAQPEMIPDKRKRDEVHQAILAKTIGHLLKRYPTSIAEDELLLTNGNLDRRVRMAVEVRLGEKKLLQEALAAGTAGEEDTEMAMGGEDGPQKRARR